MASVTLQLDVASRAQMKAAYADYLLDPVPHSEFRAQVDGVTITAYASGKVLFQGKDDLSIRVGLNSALILFVSSF